uniref:Cytochrome P450 CYP4C2 n=1 Tax=Diaphorina citri TaxID=121845 RepID=A0A482LMX1_DIACI|nr:cytochrome P450 CYP4C2 [Diaphorina citri]
MLFLWVFFLTTLVTYLVLHLCKHGRYYYLGFQLPASPMGFAEYYLLYFGSMENVCKRFIQGYETTRDSYKDDPLKKMARMWFGPKLIVLVDDVDLLQSLLRNHLRKSDFHQLLSGHVEGGLLRENHIPKYQQRKKVIEGASFKMTAIKSYVDIFAAEAVILADKVATTEGQQQTYFAEHPYTNGAMKILQLYMLRVFKPWLMVDVIFSLLGYKKQLRKALEDTRQFADQVIDKIRTKITEEKNGGSGDSEEKSRERSSFDEVEESKFAETEKSNFAEVFIRDQMDPRVPEERKISREDLLDEIQTMIDAGFDTTNMTNVFALINLALHPNIQEEVYAELVNIFGEDPVLTPTYDQLQELHVLTRVIKETLRLYPAAPMVGRSLERETVVGGYTLPAGTTICGIVYAIHRHPKHWPNPEVFDPNRFLPAEIARRNPNAYLPFSVGRYCVGYKYAMLQMKVTLSTLLRRYKVLPGDRCRCVQDIRTEFGMTLRSLPGNDVRFEPRCPK